jgi:Flp pilus assembly pilin Flp
MTAFLLKLWRNDDGQDMVEYTLLLGFIVLIAVAVLTSTRVQISTIWSTINSSLSSAIANAAAS